MSNDIAVQADHLLGRLKQLQIRYPRLLRDVRASPLSMDIEFFLADLAIDATHSLLEAGITAVHRMDRPQLMSIQLPSLLAQGQVPLVIQVLDRFLRQYTRVSSDHP
ncbi:MAG: hypothetical protein ACUVWZ_08370 [Anaerolineae bacterium]